MEIGGLDVPTRRGHTERAQIISVQMECEACHGVLQQFRNNVAFHSRSNLDAHIKVRRGDLPPISVHG